MNFKVISFYRYTEIEQPEILINLVRSKCKESKILGRILIGKEGINGAISGTNDSIEKFKLFIKKKFLNLTFREQDTKKNTYHKLVVRYREEICSFGKDVNLENTGNHLKPQELQQLYDNNEDSVIIDARNDYEYDLGHFKDAVKLDIENFREFPEEILKHVEYKNKKVVMYCTGGIRCEKASAYMKENGFTNVHQLDGGIINYVNQFPDQEWQGGLFVFDDRLVSEQAKTKTSCVHCHKETQKMINCHNLDCDKLTIVCQPCQKQWHKTCSNECKTSPKKRKEIENKEIIGIVENYYPKKNIGLIKVNKEIKKNQQIIIQGKTTNFSQTITELRDETGNAIESAGNQLITFPVKEKVRKNDRILIEV